MNTQTYTEVINQLDEVETYLTKYQNYLNQALAIPSLSCEQLAIYSVQSLGKIDQATAHVADLGNKYLNKITALQAAINIEISKLAPLTTPPTDLTSCINWITAAIGMFNTPYTQYSTQLTILIAQSTTIANKITSINASINSIASDISTAISNAQTNKGCI
jgi:hypothetical protein